MQQYPSIPSYGQAVRSPQRRENERRQDNQRAAQQQRNSEVIAFVKYDGSNLRWEWSPKQGWSKFGTRKTMFDAATEPWNKVIPLFMDTMADEIVYKAKQLVGSKVERLTAFTEFFGPSSFAGQHSWDEQQELRLFDVFTFKKGFIKPDRFVELFGKRPWCAEAVYRGPLTEEFVAAVRDGKYPVTEGVICKGVHDDFTCKVKTADWYARLKERFLDDWEQYA